MSCITYLRTQVFRKLDSPSALRGAPGPRKGQSPPSTIRHCRRRFLSGRPRRTPGENGREPAMTFQLNLEQLRKQAKERARAQGTKLADAQFELARELGFASWPRLKAYVERLSLEQPFHTDLDYYEGRASGIASVGSVSVADARRDPASRHGYASWGELRRNVEAMRRGDEPPTPFVLAYRAIEADDYDSLVELVDRFPDLVVQRGTNGNDLLGMAGGR